MNPAVVIPTFVTTRPNKRTSSSVVSEYDHMTPISEVGELPRCLESLKKVEGIGRVIILVVSNQENDTRAYEKILAISQQFPSLSIFVAGPEELFLTRQRIEQLGLDRSVREIGLVGYSAMRNFGIVLAHSFGHDSVVFVDDDVVIDDPQFLRKAVYGLGKLTRKGVPILAKTGYYYNSENSYLSQSQSKWYNHWWQQGKAFNQWIESAMQGSRLSRSNHVCGGCLALHREAFKRVSFDPWIARGEDLDYMLNLRMYGSDIWFDNQWYMRHLPPQSANEGRRFMQDIYRWIYEYRKMEYSRVQIDLMQVKPSSLEPYPGPFLEPGIERRVKITAFLRSFARPDKAEYRKAAANVKDKAEVYAERNCHKYFEFQPKWTLLMSRIENDTVLKMALLGEEDSKINSDEIASESVQQKTGFVDPGATTEIRLDIGE